MGAPDTSGSADPDDLLIDENDDQATPNSPAQTQPGDAGVVELDAGADSGSSERAQ